MNIPAANADKIPHRLFEFITIDSVIVRSPGRINLIGEHTDYNDGFVLPAAIDKAAYTSITPRPDQEVRLHSIDLNDTYTTTTDKVAKAPIEWANYLLGIVHQLQTAGISLTGFCLDFSGKRQHPTQHYLLPSAGLYFR